nr:MAG TPA: hypothetical protein [Caudoviricetes sp.]
MLPYRSMSLLCYYLNLFQTVSNVLTFCHIINYGSKHALNTQRKAQQHSLNICVYYAHFPCGMNVPFKNTIGGKPL